MQEPASSEDRPVPHSIDAEKAVLGAVLLDVEVLPLAVTVIRPADFFRQAHATVFGCMLDLQARSLAPDFVTLKDELARLGKLDEVGGPAYLSSLVDGMPHGSHVAQHAGIVREKARLRTAMAVANRLIAQAYEQETTAAQAVERAVRDLSLAIEAPAGGLVSERDAVLMYLGDLGSEKGAPIMTGYLDLDALVGGIRPGDLVIVAARPSVGKTSLALGIARHVADKGRVALFCSLEMSLGGLASRLLAWRTGVPSARFERNEATQEEYGRVASAFPDGAVGALRLEATARTVTEIGAWCRRARQDGDLAVCVVDYLQLLLPERKRDSDEAEIAAVTYALKRLAIDQHVAVIALSQLNRAPETRRDKRPRPSDLRGSGSIEQACDLALLLYREEMHKPTEENAGIAELIVAKNRNGPVGVLRLQFTKELALFRSLDRMF